uniref:Uncharacterized protein n=1 Tax=Elaeophora elaphi TaxID=1147741 RepID=A0A0R3RHV1_9BILA
MTSRIIQMILRKKVKLIMIKMKVQKEKVLEEKAKKVSKVLN